MMRRLCLVALLLPMSCQPGDTFTVLQTARTTVAAGKTPTQLTLPDFTHFDAGGLHELATQGISRAAISRAAPLQAALRLVDSASTADLTFIKSAQIFATASGQPRLLIAQGGPFLANATFVGLDIMDVALAPYLQADDSSYEVEVSLSALSRDTIIEVQVILEVQASELRTGCSH